MQVRLRTQYTEERITAVVMSLTRPSPPVLKRDCEDCSISRCKREIQNIVFENADKIPDGVYKQLMDALLIKD